MSGTLSASDFATLQPSSSSSSAQVLSVSTVRTYLAQARFAVATAEAVHRENLASLPAATQRYLESVAETLLELTQRLPHTRFDESVQVQGQWPLPDELAYTVVETLLKIGTSLPDTRVVVLQAVHKLVDSLVSRLTADDVAGAEAHSTAVCYVPQLHGIVRALQDVAFAWDAETAAALVPPLVRLLHDEAAIARLDAVLLSLPTQADALQQAREVSAARGAQPVATAPTSHEHADALERLLEHYAEFGTPLSGRFAAWCAMSALAALLAQAGAAGTDAPVRAPTSAAESHGQAYEEAWHALVTGRVAMRSLTQIAAPSDARRAFEAAAHAVAVVGAASPLFDELYLCEMMGSALKASALLSAGGMSDGDAFTLDALQTVLSEQAPLQHPVLQRAALDSVAVLARARPALAPTLLPLLRRWVHAPPANMRDDLQNGAPLLQACAAAFAACVQPGGVEAASTTTQAMLHFLRRDAGAAPLATPLMVACALAVMSRLATILAVPSHTTLTISLLLQRLEGHGRLPADVVLTHLVPLALVASRSGFVNVLTAMAEMMRLALHDGHMPLLGSGQQALLQLARGLTPAAEAQAQRTDEAVQEAGAASRKALALPILLALLVDAGAGRLGTRVRPDVALKALVPAVAALVAHDDWHVSDVRQDEVVYLFRQAWVVLTQHYGTRREAGAVTPVPLGDALTVLALKTPTLIPASARNYLDDDIDSRSVSRAAAVSSSSLDVLRHARLPGLHRGPDAKPLSPMRLAFLSAVQEVQLRCAASGRISPMLWYLAHPGVASSSLSEPLHALALKAGDAFVAHVSARRDLHAVDEVMADEVRNLLTATCHMQPAVRDAAFQLLERVVDVCRAVFARCDVVVTMLELLTLLGHACDAELHEAYLPQYTYSSTLAGITVDLTDSYAERRTMLQMLEARVRHIFTLVQQTMPTELRSALLRYLQDDAASEGLGAHVALEVARGVPTRIGATAIRTDESGPLAHALLVQSASRGLITAQAPATNAALVDELVAALQAPTPPSIDVIESLVYRGTALAVSSEPLDTALIGLLVRVPMRVCTRAVMQAATHAWSWLLAERPAALVSVVSAIADGWHRTSRERVGLYSAEMVARHPLQRKTDMSALNRAAITLESARAEELFAGHMLVLALLRGSLAASQNHSASLLSVLATFVQHMTDATPQLSAHPLARGPRLQLVEFGLRVLTAAQDDVLIEARVREGVGRLALDWFAYAPTWSYGGNLHRGAEELRLLRAVIAALQRAPFTAASLVTPVTVAQASRATLHSGQPLTPTCTTAQAVTYFQRLWHLLQLLYADEERRLLVWLNPTTMPTLPEPRATLPDLHTAWQTDARVAVQLVARFPDAALRAELARLVQAAPHRVRACAEALPYLQQLTTAPPRDADLRLRWLHMWAHVVPVEAVQMLQPAHGGTHPLVLQYAMRTLEELPVDLVFFYVPQVVQALRDDVLGYVAQFILKTSLISQLFCHQIIWNMNANKYKDDNSEVEDPLKPTLDRMIDQIVGQLSGEAQAFYEREFKFFDEVTSISGALKPYIKKSKPEKKAKIDEEMAKIEVLSGVYLPSNPEGVVVDLDRKSGRPLQSAAKAPFMATFKVRRKVEHAVEGTPEYLDVWQSAIFKVGDDCRQDLLALQVIAQFKNIFTAIGLDVYLDPYRVTATAPGCGVIDVVPNATSRDEMGRQKINDLLHFFKNRYGDERSVKFQRARINFIQSMAAYSVVCHILQIRDRHNGNIMIDGEGHLVHIDFGFLFDIGPGGMRFEPYSFKLSHEMVAVMGGPGSPGFAMFEQLVVKAFLSCRPYADDIVATCRLMLGTDLPSFKGPPTLERLHQRFKPELSEDAAAAHARWLVKDAYGNMRGTLYDLIQEKQNSIPYRR